MVIYELERSNSENYLYHQNDVNLNFQIHVHNSFEFIFVEDGELLLTVENGTVALRQGQASLILPNLVHSYATPRASRSYLCVFAVPYIGEFYEQTKGKTADPAVFSFNHPEIIRGLQEPNPNRYLVKSYLYYIAHLFDRVAVYRARDKRYADCTPKIIAYIEQHFTEKISLRTLAASLGYDYNYLSNLVNERLNIHFLTLVNEYRIHYAQYLLRSTDDSVTAISINCGYDSIRSFNRNFFAHTGMSPSDYRRQRPQD